MATPARTSPRPKSKHRHLSSPDETTAKILLIGGSSSSSPRTLIREPASTSPPLLSPSLGAQPGSTSGSARGAVGSGVVSATIASVGGIQVGGGAAAACSESPSGSRPLKRQSGVSAPAGVRPTCSVCGKVFASWKALLGHMRSHPKRQWRGCFPPPVAQQQAPRPDHDEAAFGGNIQRREQLGFDLNQPQEGDFGADDPTQTRKDNIGDSGFNLNNATCAG